ncbi:neuropeptide S receptor-like isoform X1 [Asterias rubens]|uniref:NPS/CCAP-type receptor n=1 Tax=Asterias rubens TaxID=7604 RepID=A0A0D5MEJ9_ASTRU|nr:neuropeptide S receptor-like isoform X1 [Asterias rubens]XP_033628806.1 neuropeptide S receptor-like isoform X1 [Asterias rubens]AJY59057.1 NPS/CCAP-type receptor [Asterias rubens]
MATIPAYDHLVTDSVMAGYSLNDTASTVMVPTGLPSTLEGAPNATTSVTYFSDGENRLSFYGGFQLIVLWVLFGLTVIGNSTVLLAVYVIRHKKSRLNFFVAHLAASDLLVGIVNNGYEVLYRYLGEFYGGMVFCKIIRFSQAYVINASSFQLVALSLDRFFAIVFPMDFSGSGKRANLMAVTAWIAPLFASIPSAIVFEAAVDSWGKTHCIPPPLVPGSWQYKVYTLYVVSGFFYIPLIIISTCYIFMVISIWRRSKYMMGQKPEKVKGKAAKNASKEKEPMKHRASSRGLIPKAKIKTLKMTVSIIVAFIVCWCPFSVFYTLDAFGVIFIDEANLNTAFRASAFIQNLPFLNSAINPFIYGMFSTNICQELRRFSVINWMATKLRCCKSWRPSRYGRSTTLRTDTNLTDMSEGASGTHRGHTRPLYVYTPGRTSNSDHSRDLSNSAM